MTRENRWPAFVARSFAVKTAIATRTMLGTILATLLLAGSLTAQQPPTDPAPDGNDGILGPQLIAWSEVQRPEPVSPQQQAHPDAPQSEPDAQQQTARTVTGVIAKVKNSYVLQTGDSLTYKLDDADKAKPYDGKRVRVEGILDPTTGILHVSSIQLLS
jgi:hypothetical protein